MNLKTARLLVLLMASAGLPAMAQNAAVVNGKAIPTSRVDAMVKQMAQQGPQGQKGQPDTPEMRSMIKDELINREVLAQEADRQGISSRVDVKNQVELARQSIVIRAMVADYLTKHPVKDADIKAEYDKVKASSAGKEYRTRHILVDKEDEAKDIITKLKGGEKFEDLAKVSKDPGSAEQGGDLGWAPPDAFVKPFSEAMMALKIGEYTQAPVKSQFGFHVIRLEEMRDTQFPPFDDVKGQIAESLQQRKLQDLQQELKKKAKIQ